MIKRLGKQWTRKQLRIYSVCSLESLNYMEGKTCQRSNDKKQRLLEAMVYK